MALDGAQYLALGTTECLNFCVPAYLHAQISRQTFLGFVERTATPEEAAWLLDAGGQERLPLLILVSGAPAAGKSTLAARLGQTLHLPVLHRDAIKSGLAEPRGITDPHPGRALAPLQIGIPILAADMLHDSVTAIAERISLLEQASVATP